MNLYPRFFVFAVFAAAALFYGTLSLAQQTRVTPPKPVKMTKPVRTAAPENTAASPVNQAMPFLYPDPKTIGVHPYMMQGHSPRAVTPERQAGISEQERQARIRFEKCLEEVEGFTVLKPEPVKCPLCEKSPATPCKPCGTCRTCDPKPCGECKPCQDGNSDQCEEAAKNKALPCANMCKMCVNGFPCERTLCRHDIQPRSKNMGNSCDLSAGDEPCGTCDACREHRSDPCEHADDGWDRMGQFNPYHEPRLFSVIPRPVLDLHNNGARKFPVYYNPAPYYRPTWNPSILAGYARPYTFRWTCPLCNKETCTCDAPGLAGQVPFAYACKFCNRNPCACAQNICDVTKPMDPKGVASALDKMKNPPKPQPQEVGAAVPGTEDTQNPAESSGGGNLYDPDDDSPPDSEKKPQPPAVTPMDVPKTPEPLPAAGSGNIS
ncbi:MAG: hypothetical protein LBH00_04865 [Planctomycetaceae bacterium]|nr:hypothetical protein [Planctomycetaceae bacterium]